MSCHAYYFSVWSLSFFSLSTAKVGASVSHVWCQWEQGLDHNYDEVVAYFGFVHDFSTKEKLSFPSLTRAWPGKR